MRIKNTGMYALRILGIVCFVYGIGLLIYGKGAGMVPVWLIFGTVCIGLSFKKPFYMVFSRKWVRFLLLAVVTSVIIFAGIIFAYGYGTGPEAESDYIIVLGAKVNGELPSRTLQYRLETAYQYLVNHHNAKAVLSGGQGEDEGIGEAEAMRRYLTARGIDDERLVLEEKSTNTYENLQNSIELLGANENLKLTVVTSDFHVLRAKIIASKLGRQVNGLGAKTYLPLIPNYYLREMLAILKEII